MADDTGDKTLEASAKKLEQARRRGDVPTSREGSNFGLYLAIVIALGVAGPLVGGRFATLLLPLVEQPEAFLELTPDGLAAAAKSLAGGLAIALAPLAMLLVAGALLPHIAQNSVTVATERLQLKWSNLSPGKGIKKLFGVRGLVEFAKGLLKAATICVAGWQAAKPLYDSSANLLRLDPSVFPGMMANALFRVLFATMVIAGLIAAFDVPFQHFAYHRRQRMTVQEMKDEMRSSDGDPHVKARQRKLRQQRSQRRMMNDVPTATVVITNPTHFAVALRYERGKDAAPICVAKGQDVLAKRIRELATANNVPLVENKPLARALHAATEVGDVIPKAHFEAVAQIIGLIWAQRPGGPKPQG